jgi:hypothetical protein
MPISTIGSNSLNQTSDLTINGQTVGKGGGNVATNTAHGLSALAANTSGSNNVAVGYRALSSMATGNTNVAVGQDALRVSVAGTQNTAVGFQSMAATLTADANSALGLNSLSNNTTGNNNVAIGYAALTSNTTASGSTAVGYQAGYTQTVSTGNTFLGYRAGYVFNPSSGDHFNTFVGYSAGSGQTSGFYNTYVGLFAGNTITTGQKNTILGGYNGNQGGLDIRTASNNIVLSDGDGNPRGYFNTDVGGWRFNNGGTANSVVAEFVNASASQPYALAFNFSAATPNNTTNYFLYCYDSTNVKAIIYSNGSFQSRANSYGGISDIKLKQDIIDATSQWDDVKAIKFRKYRFKDDPTGALQLGVIAQELEETSPNLVYESPDFITNEAGEREELGTTTKAVKYSVLYMKAVKALQEAMTRIEALEIKLDAQAAEIAELKAKVA